MTPAFASAHAASAAPSARSVPSTASFQGALVTFHDNAVRLTLNGVTTTVATDSAARLNPGLQELASVSPDGKTVLYVTADGLGMANATFTTINLVSGSKRVIANLGNSFWPRQPLWSPDSSQILYTRVTPQTFAPQLWVMRATGSQQRLVVAGGALTHRSLEGFAITAPQWSADGQSIVFYDSAFKPTTEWTVSLRTSARTSMPATVAPSICPTTATRSGVLPMVCSGGMCSVPIYYQNQQYYSNDVMLSAGETIGNAGCALTSLTMLFDYFQYIDGGAAANHPLIGDPRGMNNCLSPWGYADGLNWVGAQDNPPNGPGCDHRTTNWIQQVGFNWSTLDTYLRSGWPVIVGGCWDPADFPYCHFTHWVVVVGGNGSDIASNYWINNPTYGGTTVMQGLIDRGFGFEWMSLYQNGAGTGSPCE